MTLVVVETLGKVFWGRDWVWRRGSRSRDCISSRSSHRGLVVGERVIDRLWRTKIKGRMSKSSVPNSRVSGGTFTGEEELRREKTV